jgi:transposase
MAPLIISPRQRAELEYLASHSPVSEERCRAQALLWLDEGESAEQVAESLRVSRRTVYCWRERFHDRDGHDMRQRLADAPRPGRPRAGGGGADPWIAEVIETDPRTLPPVTTRRSGPHLCWCDTWRTIMRSRSRARRSAGPSHAWTSGGSGPGTNWPAAPTPGGSQKGAETRPEWPYPQRRADAR